MGHKPRNVHACQTNGGGDVIGVVTIVPTTYAILDKNGNDSNENSTGDRERERKIDGKSLFTYLFFVLQYV